MTINIKALQKRLKVTADGMAGTVTWAALFARFGASPERANALGRSAAEHFTTYGITANALRLVHLIAQLAHESGGFRYMEEIASGAAYEGRKDLGNVRPGDGRRYKARGPIQLTGRANYRLYGEALGLPLEDEPERVSDPFVGLLVALEYWRRCRINVAADADDVIRVTKLINGGKNGLDDRKRLTVMAKALVL